jgi:hypothetical protein
MSERRTGRQVTLRWLKFNAVGALGVGVQLAVLLTLKSGFHLAYLPATALAVEVTVLHNFLWHERYTWADRVQTSWRKSLPRAAALQSDHWPGFHRRKYCADEMDGRPQPHELSRSQRHCHRVVFAGKFRSE